MSNGIGHNTLNDISKVYLSQVAEETPGEKIDRKSQEGVAKRKAAADSETEARAKKASEFQKHKQFILAKGGRPVDALDSWHKKQAYERNVRKEENETLVGESRLDKDPPSQFEKGDADRGNPDYMQTLSLKDEEKWERLQRMRRASKKKVDEAVQGEDTQDRKDAAAERRSGEVGGVKTPKRLSPSKGREYVKGTKSSIDWWKNHNKKEEYSSWRTDLREIIDDSPMTDIKDEEEVKEKKVKNKVKTSAIGGGIKIGEAIAEIGGEVLQITEVDVQTQQPNPKQEKEQRKETQQYKQVQQKERQAAQKKRMVLLAKIRALRAGGGADITASYEPEGEHLDELVGGAGTLVRQGVKFGGKKGGRVVQAGQKKAIEGGRVVQQKVKQGNPSKMVGSGRAEKAGAVVGGLAGAVGGGLLDGPLPVGDIVGGIAGSKVGGKIGRQVDKAFAKEESEVIDEGGLTSLKATTYGMPHEKRKAILDKYRKSEKNRGTDTKKGRDAGAIARERLNKEDLDKYDRYNRMIRHKQDKYGKNIIGADYNLENERKVKGWKKKLNKEETEVKEATYPGHDEKGNPLKPKDNRYRVSNADKKANTPAWQKYKSGDKRYTKLDHVDEGYVDKKKSEVIKALTKKKDKFVKKYGKDAPDVMYAVAAKTAKKKGDTSKSDDRYAYEEVQLEGFKEDEIETMRAQHKAREEQKKKLPQYKPVPLKRSGKNTSSDSDRDRLAKSVRGENIPGFKGGRLD